MNSVNIFSNTETFKKYFSRRIVETYGRSVEQSHKFEKYIVLGTMVRDYASIAWKETKEKVQRKEQREMVYFSMEFLLGKMMLNNIKNLGLYDIIKDGLNELDIDLNELLALESDAGLGNGGLGRLAACFMDSLASLNYPGHGNTIRYKYGFFRQKIVNGKQKEIPDNWLKLDYPFEIKKAKHAVTVKFYGNVVTRPFGNDGRFVFELENAECVRAVPYDMPMIGYDGKTVNTLRCWDAVPDVEDLPKHKDFQSYLNECNEISQSLYPDDSTEHGKILRLKQQYFFVCAGIAAQIKNHLRRYKSIHNIHEKLVFQLNDTHPAIAVAEMMRVLLDEFYLEWDEAWNITTSMMAYTNHTILSEALEKWPIHYVKTLLPRIYMIIEEIHRRFVVMARSKNLPEHRIQKMMILRDGQVHMANLAIIGSYSVNGVAYLHTEILKNQEMKEFYALYPEKFNNKTNGITHRRWLAYSNPELLSFLNKHCNGDVCKDITLLKNLNNVVDNYEVQEEFLNVKNTRKHILANFIKERNDIDLDVNSIFDIQVKRLHAYKRQLLNCLHIIYLYQQIKENKDFSMHPQTFIFGAKAAPSYVFAKNVIELINCMASKINNDPEVNKFIKVVFVENYDVTSSEILMPGADVSEQISLAGKEASGTGNMKFMMNGAVTLGTLDGANVEIYQNVGDDNIVIFGLTSEQVKQIKDKGEYSSLNIYAENPFLRKAINSLMDGTWHENKNEFRVIVDDLLYKNDEYLLLEDFESYRLAQEKINKLYQDRHLWAKMCLVNIANSSFFSSDRTIQEYVDDIWKLERVE